MKQLLGFIIIVVSILLGAYVGISMFIGGLIQIFIFIQGNHDAVNLAVGIAKVMFCEIACVIPFIGVPLGIAIARMK